MGNDAPASFALRVNGDNITMLMVRVGACALAASLVACNTSPVPLQGVVSAGNNAPPEFTAAAIATGLIAPGDTLAVTVFREPDVSLASVMVNPDGTISMPLLGAVRVAGMTPTDLAAMLRLDLGVRYLVNPQVTVNITEAPSRTITVEGAVGQPGVYRLQNNTTLLSALALAQSPSRVARLSDVSVLRTIGGERYLAVFDVSLIRSGRAADILLQPSDTVIVGVSGRRQTWQDFLQASPLLGIFARI